MYTEVFILKCPILRLKIVIQTDSNLPIAVFDSGVGGLAILTKLMDALPGESFIYYADIRHAPYGDKHPDMVSAHIEKAVAWLDQKGIKSLVLACNTATSVCIQSLRSKYTFPVIGMEPAIKPALTFTTDKKILVLATKLTLKKEKYHVLAKKLEAEDQVINLDMNSLVQMAEDFDFQSPEVSRYIDTRLQSIDKTSIGAIVLGCTHFIYFKDNIRQFFESDMPFFDGIEGTVRQVLLRTPPADKDYLPTASFVMSDMDCDIELLLPYINKLGGHMGNHKSGPS